MLTRSRNSLSDSAGLTQVEQFKNKPRTADSDAQSNENVSYAALLWQL